MSNCNCGTSQAPRTARAIDLSKLGRCRFCIYSSLATALAGWSAYVPIMFDTTLEPVAYAILAVTVPATLLFLTHIGAMIAGRIARP